jgi:glycosyltransferase involved in cell wall biosynthesis
MRRVRVLALNPWDGGSHRAFLDGWIPRSRHEWTVLRLPPRKWKWRMRQGAVALAAEVADLADRDAGWDAILATDMLDLATFRGLAPAAVRSLPAVAYFHENQLTYPVDHPSEFDFHFAFTNLTTALSAERVWWNSAFHRDSMLAGLEAFLRRMPDHRPLDAPTRILERSEVRPPGIEPFPDRGPRPPGPLRILWAARWEADKGPETFFAAIDRLADRGVHFVLDVLGGGRTGAAPPCFAAARARHAGRIRRFGWAESREEYRRALLGADVAVSTARHEFFGIAMVEAAAAGALPLLPRALAYPEVFGEGHVDLFHDGTPDGVAERLAALARRLAEGDFPSGAAARAAAARHDWDRLAPVYDELLAEAGDAPVDRGSGRPAR